jgi:hypothetical protein
MPATTWRVNNSTALGGEVCSPWQANHAYALGARCVCTVAYATAARRALVFEVTDDGTSHATTQPTWPANPGDTVVDNGVTWTCRSPGDGSWDNASCYLYYVLNHASPAAGDTVYIDDGHAESWSYADYVILGINSNTNPLKIYCVDKSSDALSTGAIIEIANGSNKYFQFKYFGYVYGVTFKQSSNRDIQFNEGSGPFWIFEGNGTSKAFSIGTGYAIVVNGGQARSSVVKVINAGIQLDNASGRIHLYGQNGYFEWVGGVLTAASGVTKLIDGDYGPRLVKIRDVDLSAVGSAKALVDVGDGSFNDILFERCKFPASFTPVTGTWNFNGGRVRCHHCSDANNTYDFREDTPQGTIVDEETIVRTGGASDGVTPQSWKMSSGANNPDTNNHFALESPPIVGWTESTTEKTFTIECLLDSATNLQDDEVWMELEYPANGTDGLGAVARDKCAQLGTPADKSAGVGDENWTTTGLTNPNSFKCSVTVTPGKAGPITARIYVPKASTTIYVDPIITES